jgi:hypothetical protein
MHLDELKSWLGPALDRLDDEQLDRLERESDRLDRTYPDRDERDDWTAGMSAAVQYVLGDLGPDPVGDAGRAVNTARRDESRAIAAAKQLAVMAIEDMRLSEREAAKMSGLDRMTIRRAAEKM